MPELKLNKRYKYAGDIMPKLLDIGFDLETATDFLNGIEDADVVEVRHGEWIIKIDEYGNEYMMCSYCEDEFYPAYEDTVDSTPNYCHTCGAKMDGERKDIP